MYWYWIHVYNYTTPLGSFYTDTPDRREIAEDIDRRYGAGMWTRFTVE